MYQDRQVTVVIPCLNEEEGIQKVLSRIPEFVDEVIVVDNDSTDGTARIAREMGARVIHENVRGYGRAYKTGLLHARGDIIVTLDGDHSYPVDSLSYLIESLLRSQVGFVSASRFPIQNPDAMALKNLLGNKCLSLMFSLLYFRRVRDSQSGMWIFYKDALTRMNLESDGMAFSEEIKIEPGHHPPTSRALTRRHARSAHPPWRSRSASFQGDTAEAPPAVPRGPRRARCRRSAGEREVV